MLVISAKSGQLGNRLLLFANFIAFAIEHNLKVFNPAFEEYADFFLSTSQDLLCSYPVLGIKIKGNKYFRNKYYSFNRYLAERGVFKTISLTREQPFTWKNFNVLEQLDRKSLNFFQGWLFRDGWFVSDTDLLQKHGDAIRAYFTPLTEYQLKVNILISTIRKSADIVIGIHIRHGDYQQHQGGRYFYTIPEYVQVMESAQKLFPDKQVTFLICSNVEQDKHLFDKFNYTYGNNHIIEDMYSLAECDYIIGPPSSYTMWASFYGDRPLYMIRDCNKILHIKDFVCFYEWKGIFHAAEDWSKSFWEWTH